MKLRIISSITAATLFATHSLAAQSATDTINPEIARLKQEVIAVAQQRPFDYAAYTHAIERARERVYQLIAQDALRTPADFYTASTLAGDPTGFYEYRRVEHELALVALVLGHPDALRRVALSWDGLNWSIGRGQRLGSYKRNGVADNMDPVPAPAVVRAVFDNLAAARARAARASDNPELERLRAEDQAVREPPTDQAKQRRMQKEDPVRRGRVLELIAAGLPVTGRDFHNAALVMQHGQSVDDFRLAHELAIAAVALGDTAATWLLSRTYDRLLLHLGHRQRLNTQYGGVDQKLLPVDSAAVNERIRRALN